MDEIISYKMCAVKVRNAKLRNYLNTLATRGVNILDLVISSVPNQINNITLLSPENSGLFRLITQ